jgi:hypothetical protein
MHRECWSEDANVDGRIILEWILVKLGGKVWTGCIWLWIRTSEHCNQPSGSIKGRYLSTTSVTTCFSRRTLLHGTS